MRWENEGRYDILEYVDFFYYNICPTCKKGHPLDEKNCKDCNEELEIRILGGDLWFDPETGEELVECPFLSKTDEDKYICEIQEAKPQKCEDFPFGDVIYCDKCGFNFVNYFKDVMHPEILLDEYLTWTTSKFTEHLLKEIDSCPKCGEPIAAYHDWAKENCPAVKDLITNT